MKKWNKIRKELVEFPFVMERLAGFGMESEQDFRMTIFSMLQEIKDACELADVDLMKICREANIIQEE
jgi:hypothetical protein